MLKKVRNRCTCLGLSLLSILTLGGCGSNSTSGSGNTTAAPTFSPGGGAYNTSKQVTIADSTAGAVLYCTTDGTTPTTSSPKCAEPTTVFQTQFLQAIAAAPGMAPSLVASAAYTINLNAAATPTFAPAGGTYASAQQVTIADATSGVNIYYTTDGSVPSASSTLYTGPVAVSSSESLSAIAVASGYSNSAVASATYTIGQTVATPTFSLPSGNYTSAQMVTIADATANAVVYYTTDGSTPSATSKTSSVYNGPIAVSQTEVINAIAMLSGNSSALASAAYTISAGGSVGGPEPAPVFTPVSGTSLTSGEPVTIMDADSAATIYYTLDGSQPSSSSTPYSGAITLTTPGQVTITAIAVDGTNTSIPANAIFTIPVPAPTFMPASGTMLTVGQTMVTILDADTSSSAAIYYTLDGSTPSATGATSMQYTVPFTLTVSGPVTINAIAIDTASSAVATVSYTVVPASVPVPSFSQPGGAAVQGQVVTLTDADKNAAIYYTTNGSTPTVNSTPYTLAGITLSTTGSETIEAIAVDSGVSSAAASASYTVTASSVAPPVIAPAAGTVTVGQSITIAESDAKAKVYYTLNGTTPTATTGTLYTSGGFTLSTTGSITVEAIAIDGTNSSPVVSAMYTVSPVSTPAPTFSPASGTTLTTGQTISIADTDTNATIYYTEDGSTPTSSSPKYTVPFTLTASATVNAIAIDTGVSSTVASAAYTVPVAVPSPTFSPTGGTQTAGTTVSITDGDHNATIYYTEDGSTPSAASSKYTTVIPLSSGMTTINAIAIDNGADSTVSTATFTVSAGPSVSGVVMSGTVPVKGAQVQLYTAGTSKYGAAGTPLGTAVTTNSSGAFTANYTSCPAAPGDLVYIVATDGDAGKGANTDSAMMTALGPCSKLSSSTTYTINETTTVASAYALSAFMTTAPNVGATAPATTCTATTVTPGNAQCNYPGLVNAFATIANLVNVTSGQALSITPAYAANNIAFLNSSTAPQARVDTLANILNACVASGGGCTSLFGAAKSTSGTEPTNTLQAILNIAQNPGVNVSTLFGLASSAYTPALTAAPNDWTLALTFTGGGLGISPSVTGGTVTYAGTNFTGVGPTQNSAMAIDGNGNIWVSSGGYDYNAVQNTVPLLAEFNSLGAPLTPATTLSSGTTPAVTYGGFNPEQKPTNAALGVIAIDQSNNVWLGDNSSLGNFFEISQKLAVSSTLKLPQEAYSLAIDLNNNEWVFADGALEEIHNGVVGPDLNQSPSPGQLLDITFDVNAGLWGSDLLNSLSGQPQPDIEKVSTQNGSILYDAFPAGGTYSTTVADNAGNIYGCGDPAPSGQTGGQTLNVFNGIAKVSSAAIATGRGCGAQLVLDGSAHLFAITNGYGLFPNANFGTSIDEFTTAGKLLSPQANGYTGTSSEEPPAITYDGGFNSVYGSGSAAIDGSGNLWVLNPDTNGPPDANGNPTSGNVLVEYVGIAAPVVTPISLATYYGTLGTRP